MPKSTFFSFKVCGVPDCTRRMLEVVLLLACSFQLFLVIAAEDVWLLEQRHTRTFF
jgi:hypothetical protein